MPGLGSRGGRGRGRGSMPGRSFLILVRVPDSMTGLGSRGGVGSSLKYIGVFLKCYRESSFVSHLQLLDRKSNFYYDLTLGSGRLFRTLVRTYFWKFVLGLAILLYICFCKE